MKNKKLKKTSLVNLIAGYICAIIFFFLVLMNLKDRASAEKLEVVIAPDDNKSEIQNISHETEVVYSNDYHYTIKPNEANSKRITTLDNNVELLHSNLINSRATHIDLNRDEQVHSVIDTGNDFVSGVYRNDSAHDVVDKTHIRGGVDQSIDPGLLDRRLKELDGKDIFGKNTQKDKLNRHDKIGFREYDNGVDMSKITLARDNDEELGDIDLDFDKDSKGYGTGKGGQLYAYSYPSQGVGAGIGSSAIGAGSGAGAGISGGIGEGVLNGEVVPTLGGVGTGAKPLESQPSDAIPSGGVGGLIGGAGAGGAAGLTQGYIKESLGMTTGVGQGVGYGANGRGEYNYDHLPQNGALHIMIHVDGSGSLLSTRVKLEEMKETLLKKALLPYYNNDESLYNKRVTIIDDAGERTLNFFTQASKKDNVLAIAFQDEAAPDYHLPNFNKVPQNKYSHDLSKLKNQLNEYNGLYRGVIFQVDRGKVFSKSFKEMVQFAWNGQGYLEQENLKKYHRDNNQQNIKNKNGIVFSDEYHARSEAEPQYYMDLILNASKRIGIDLQASGAGLTDGKYTKN
jgi:hypothetical protein